MISRLRGALQAELDSVRDSVHAEFADDMSGEGRAAIIQMHALLSKRIGEVIATFADELLKASDLDARAEVKAHADYADELERSLDAIMSACGIVCERINRHHVDPAGEVACARAALRADEMKLEGSDE